MVCTEGNTNRECSLFWGFVLWKWIKSRGAGMWGLSPFREPANGDKAENEFSPLYPHSLLTVGCFAPHSHPSPPEEKAASRKKSRLRRKKTAPIVCRTLSCSSAGGWIAFLGVFRTHFMAEVGGYRFVGFVRIWTKTGLFCGPKAKWNTWNTRNTWNTWNTFCGCRDCFFVNISKNLLAKLRMVWTGGNTKRECCFFRGG